MTEKGQNGRRRNQNVGQKLRVQAQQILNQMDQFPLRKDLVMAVRETPSPVYRL